jgi:hypothetical protein
VRSWIQKFESHTRGAAIGFVVALVMVGATTASSSGHLTGGSLPLKGDQLAAGAGGPTDGYVIGTGSHWNVLNWAPGVQADNPSSFSQNYVDASGRTAQKMWVTTGANPDVGSAATVANMSVSDDSGKSFLTTEHNYPAQALNMVRLPDGSLLTIDFIPEWRNAEHTQSNLLVRTSPDGKKWTLHKAPLTVPDDHLLGPMSNGLRVNKRPIVLADGTLIVPAYTVFRGTSRQTSIVLQSSDLGQTWTLRSIIPAAATPGTNEVGWAYTVDGQLTAIMRTVDSPITNLVQSFSGDDGRTWSESTKVMAPDGTQAQGILPDLLLQPNGTLLLLTGRPDVRVLVDYDGTARHWDTQTTIFANYPSTGANGRFDGTSANNSMESVGANRSVVYYDQCAPWGCGAYDEQYGVSAEYFSAVTPNVGRIDVMSRLLDGTATVTGTFARKNKAFPEQRPRGAFDGSTLAGAEAVLTAKHGAPQLTLKLDKPYAVDRIGLMLGHGAPQTATVQLSSDGQTWSPVVTASERRDRALRYTDVAPQTAQYVRVVGLAGVTTTVTELEVYSADVDGFENEVAFAVPRGWTDAVHAWVTDVPDNLAYADFGGFHSSTALRLFDKWTDDNARITRPFSARDHVTADLQWGYQDERTDFTISVDGDQDAAAWQFAIAHGATATAPQVVRAFDGHQWTTLGSLSTLIPARTYVPLHVTANGSSATLTVNGQAFTTSTRAGPGDSFAGLTMTTGDPTQYGGFYLLDDVAVA